MSKKKAVQTSDVDIVEVKPTIYDELLKTGTAVLEAKTREDLAEMVDNIPAECRYGVGAVGRKADGSAYTLQVDLIH